MEPIAIVGVSFKLPQGTTDESTFWDMLENRKNAMTAWPETRISVEALLDESPRGHNKLRSRGGHFLTEDPACFDAPFFSITTEEAASMDPQQRWALETTFHAFENAGIPVEDLKGSQTAVYGSSISDDYSRVMSRDPDTTPQTGITGVQSSILPNRVSWFYDLLGSSISVDTACSSTMVALDLACQSLRNREASLALVFGTSLMMVPDGSLMLGNMNFTSPDSVCWSFDYRANGYGRGEGIIAMVLKPVSRALEDGDMIRAIVRSSGSNQDGHTVGLTQPSMASQESLIRHVYQKAGLDYSMTRYVEAHGTGTPLGDLAEIEALGKVFRDHRSAKKPLYVGSVKSNIGHLEAGSGLAGVLKSVMILEKGVIPANALFEELNPAIDSDFLRVEVPSTNMAWPSPGLRRISVNSFGFGGTNSHVVLDSASHFLGSQGLVGNHMCTDISSTQETLGRPANGLVESALQQDGLRDVPKLLVWSAANKKAIKRVVQEYGDYYQAHVFRNRLQLGRLAYTLAARRSRMSWRTFAVIDADHDIRGIARLPNTEPVQSIIQALKIAFVFTGQGAQYTGMGLELMQYNVFEESLKRANLIYHNLGCPWSLLDELRSEKNIHFPEYSQPLTTAVQIALVELTRSFGIIPAIVVGHSSGEIAAAYAVGALSQGSAYKIAYFRGKVANKIIETNPPSAMISVNLSENEALEFINKLGPSTT